MLPERFGRKRVYALGKTSGKANIAKNLQDLGITLTDAQLKLVTEEIIQLGDKKEIITQEDLPYILSDVLNFEQTKKSVKIITFSLNHAHGLQPTASVKLEFEHKTYEAHAKGDGQYDAFFNALKHIYKIINRSLPELTHYSVAFRRVDIPMPCVKPSLHGNPMKKHSKPEVWIATKLCRLSCTKKC